MHAEHTDYGWLFREPAEETDGDIIIDLEHLPPELKQAALQILLNQIDRDTAAKKLAEVIQQLEFDITAAELSAYLFKPGHA
ncbi:hypothetical protein ACKTG8_003829 [Cronobacter sakazakii]|uniref:hypothetical protein n=1 Tax=Cronobacter TaxID=413496 RepID=UPI001EF78866|nr:MULTISPECIES: hypothetical protein [Cronobacter]MDI7592682.1 hypothetical protein [Cronobacter malonaticus]MDI7599150.1 hypothetical protein [Cronobacter sakazakii]MDK1036710.1 hypothetical protein [Cronobacter sakazakii]MDK1123468.1 hypothetical protein [Cronobacter sakazakii]MDT3599715.1 hypothetical protein [Cronobacter malonaticus]